MVDVFRKESYPLTEAQHAKVLDIKETAEELAEVFNTLPSSREVSIAMTKLEEAVMWATKAATVKEIEAPVQPDQPE